MFRIRIVWFVALSLALSCPAAVRFQIMPFSPALPEPVNGRIVVYVKKRVDRSRPPHILSNSEYVFGIDANNMKRGSTFDVDDRATSCPIKLSELPEGDYLAQAVFDWHHDDGNWMREPENVYSPVVSFGVFKEDRIVQLPLSDLIDPVTHPTKSEASELFEMRSTLLSEFHHRNVVMRAAVLFPRAFDRTRNYPAIYRICGSGGDGISVLDHPENGYVTGPASDELAKYAFVIWLDPQSGNGHTLFANSDNNGPCGDALVRELIPALEAKFPLVSSADARIVTGHSSGGWAALWLTLQHPDIFGACFALSPDPVDFHCLELIDIYNMNNAYSGGQREFPGARWPGAKTVREENQIEEVLGPHNSSGQDWDAWQACWGRRDSSGHIASLFDPITGAINRDEAEAWCRYDITDLLRRNPDRYAPIFHQRIRLIVGDQDTFFLNNAVAKLKEELDRHPSDDTTGYIRILPAYDHMSITNAPEVRAWSQEILDWLRSSKPKG